MKFSFQDKFICAESFIELCNKVQYYGFDGMEISNVLEEKSSHADSIFRSSITADAKRKLVNRHIAIAALNFPNKITENSTEELIKYVDYASLANVGSVIVSFDQLPRV